MRLHSFFRSPDGADGGNAKSATTGPIHQPPKPEIPDFHGIQSPGPDKATVKADVDAFVAKFPNDPATARQLHKQILDTPVARLPGPFKGANTGGRIDPTEAAIKAEVLARLGRHIVALENGQGYVDAYPRISGNHGLRAQKRAETIAHLEAVYAEPDKFPILFPDDAIDLSAKQRLTAQPQVQSMFDKARILCLDSEIFRLKNFHRCWPEDRCEELRTALGVCNDLEAIDDIKKEMSEYAALLSNPAYKIASLNSQTLVARHGEPAKKAVQELYSACRQMLNLWKAAAVADEQDFFAKHRVAHHPTNVSKKFDATLAELNAVGGDAPMRLDWFGLNWRSTAPVPIAKPAPYRPIELTICDGLAHVHTPVLGQ